MNWSAVIGVFLFVSTAAAQPTIGTITGTVSTPDGNPATGILIQARHVESGMVHDARTGDGGQYTLSVPQGVYDLIVPAVESRFDRYERKNITVAAAQFFYADIKLERRGNASADTPARVADHLLVNAGATYGTRSDPRQRHGICVARNACRRPG
jgi:hypothetical protein